MINLDNNATTPIDPRVREVVIEELHRYSANPSSVHSLGRAARLRLSEARRKIADILNVKPEHITFTSGATESLNTLINGFKKPHCHVITSSIEHSAILKPLEGCSVTYLQTGLWGAVKAEEVEAAITPQTQMIVLSAANSETGVKNPIEEIAKVAKSHNILFIVDAVALFGKEPFSIPEGVSAIVLSGHKIHGPSGIGLTWTPHAHSPLMMGGGQEFGRRSGTENLPAILGLAKAIECQIQALPHSCPHMQKLRDHLENSLKAAFPSVIINGQGPRVVNTSNITFPGSDGESLLMELDQAGIAVSLGSACASGALEPSHVLLAMGISSKLARSTLRFSLSRMTTEEEIAKTLSALKSFLGRGTFA